MAAPSTSKMNDENNPWERKRPKQPPNIDELLMKYGKKYFKNGSVSGGKSNGFVFGLLLAALFLFF